MTSNQVVTEIIPDYSIVFRLIIPNMRQEESSQTAINHFIFQEDQGNRISVIWDKHIDHTLSENKAIQKFCRLGKNEIGYQKSLVGVIRSIQTNDGHKLDVTHQPENNQGLQHAEIGIIKSPNKKLEKLDKKDLQIRLLRAVNNTIIFFN